MNTSVSFELAKLLKEKGFDKPVHQYYQFIRDLSSEKDKTWQFVNSSFLVRESDATMFPDEGKNGIEVCAYSDRLYRDFNFKTSDDFVSAPTIAEVIMWLYERHDIWTEVNLGDYGFYWALMSKERNNIAESEYKIKFNSPAKAYEAAIEYCLTKLV